MLWLVLINSILLNLLSARIKLLAWMPVRQPVLDTIAMQANGATILSSKSVQMNKKQARTPPPPQPTHTHTPLRKDWRSRSGREQSKCKRKRTAKWEPNWSSVLNQFGNTDIACMGLNPGFPQVVGILGSKFRGPKFVCYMNHSATGPHIR